MAGNDPPNAEGNSKGKGKGKETDDTSTPTTSTSTTNDSPSVFSRIAQSAAGLSRDMVSARPSGGDLASLTSAEKGGQTSRGQPAAAGEGSSATLTSWSAPQSGTGSSHAQQHAMEQDEAFSQFLDGTSIDMSIPTEPIIGLDDDAAMEAAWTQQTTTLSQNTQSEDLHTSTTTTQFISQQSSSSAVAEQERIDGLDVVNLLAVDGPPEEEPDYGDIELAEDEITALRRALFGDRNSEEQYSAATTTNNLDWDTVLNFIPDFVRPSPGGGYEEEAGAQFGAGKTQETQAALGLGHTPESTRQWLDQWHGVLTRYNDEVWGGLSALVAQAREEVDQLQQSEDSPQKPSDQPPASTKALDRLRQILGHIRE